jgi:hypothetical protein
VTDNIQRDICVVRTLKDGDWVASFVIDGRRYSSQDKFEQVKQTAFRELNRRWMGAEFETSKVGESEPSARLPTWEEFIESLPSIGNDING